jgi:hypothetical protein
MRARGVGLVLAAALALIGCGPPSADAPAAAGLLLPGLATKLPTLEAIELRTAGDVVAVRLERAPSGWTVRERTGWPADPALVRTLIEDVAAAQRIEAKTARPDRYARIGVEAVADAAAGGIEMRLRGRGWNEAVVVGDTPPLGGGRFVRRAADAQAWLVDRPLALPRDPAAWLDTHLFDVPLARIAGVRSADAAGHAFALAHRDDRFRVVDAPSAAMGGSYRGDAMAGALEQLHLDDVAADDGAAAERTVDYTLVDGAQVRLEAWRVDGRVWVRVGECPAGSAPPCATAARWAHRRFLLPAHVAATLLMTRAQVLAGTP